MLNKENERFDPSVTMRTLKTPGHFGQLVRQLREANGWTGAECAGRVGWKKSATWYHHETITVQPRRETVEKIATGLCLTELELAALYEHAGYSTYLPQTSVEIKIGTRLCEARTSNRLTMQEVGDLIGVEKITISGYESGKIEPSASTLYRLSKVLDVPVSFFYGEDGKEKGKTETINLSNSFDLKELSKLIVTDLTKLIESSLQMQAR